MIRKIINADGTFGANYDENLKTEYVKTGQWPTESYIDLTFEQAAVIDQEPTRYVYRSEIPGLFLGEPMGVVEREGWAQEQFETVKKNKYSEITDAYDYANKYYVLNLYDDFYGNVSWLVTWNKVVNLCEANKVDIIPNPVRYYKKISASKFKNVDVSEVKVNTLKRQIQMLEGVQFNILQPKRNSFYKMLEEAKSAVEVKAIKVNYGITINEQDSSDTNEKIEF